MLPSKLCCSLPRVRKRRERLRKLAPYCDYARIRKISALPFWVLLEILSFVCFLCSKETKRVTLWVLLRNMLVFLECVLIWSYIFLSNTILVLWILSLSFWICFEYHCTPDTVTTSSFLFAFYYMTLIRKVEDVLISL